MSGDNPKSDEGNFQDDCPTSAESSHPGEHIATSTVGESEQPDDRRAAPAGSGGSERVTEENSALIHRVCLLTRAYEDSTNAIRSHTNAIIHLARTARRNLILIWVNFLLGLAVVVGIIVTVITLHQTDVAQHKAVQANNAAKAVCLESNLAKVRQIEIWDRSLAALKSAPGFLGAEQQVEIDNVQIYIRQVDVPVKC